MLLYSDLHLDASPCAIDYGIVAGDICDSVSGICIPGNHDYWYDYYGLNDWVYGWLSLDKPTLLGTMWTDLGYNGTMFSSYSADFWEGVAFVDKEFSKVVSSATAYMLDYRYGKVDGTRMHFSFGLNEYFKFLQLVAEMPSEACRIVTHHSPASRAMIQRFYGIRPYDRNMLLSHAFHSSALCRVMSYENVRSTVLKHGLTWAFGHTHERVDLLIDFGKFVRNNPTWVYGVLGEHADDLEQELIYGGYIERREFGSPFVESPGMIRIVSNPRGYSRIPGLDEWGNEYKGIEI